MRESVIYFGGAIKALDENGKVGGYAVRHSDGTAKDLSGEYFAADTYLGAHEGDGVDVLFHHGQPLALKGQMTAAQVKKFEELADHLFSPVKTKRDDVGLWAETVLDMADEYEKAVFGLVKAGKLGWSTGTASHTAKKTDDGKITRWPIIEISLTPTPCEPLNRAVSLKALDSVKFAPLGEEKEEEDERAATIPNAPNGLAAKLNQHIDDLADSGRTKQTIIAQLARETSWQVADVESLLGGASARPSNAKLKAFARVLDVSYEALKAEADRDYQQTIKGIFETALSERMMNRWELESTYNQIIRKLANAASAAQMAGLQFDLSAKIKEATDEYGARLTEHALKQIDAWLASATNEEFYLKAIIDTAESVKTLDAADLDTHSQLAEAVERGFYTRLRVQHEARKRESSSGTHNGQVKAGRMLSEKNRKRLDDHIKGVEALLADMRALLDESQPMADDEQKRAALSVHLRQQARNRQLGVTANV